MENFKDEIEITEDICKSYNNIKSRLKQKTKYKIIKKDVFNSKINTKEIKNINKTFINKYETCVLGKWE